MQDSQIVGLYFERSEQAISQTAEKYGNFCNTIAYNILHNLQDSEECVNDTYLRAWNTIPPKKPEKLSTFLGRITRNLALDKYRRYSAQKRGGSETELVLDELENCVSSLESTDDSIDELELAETINSFLSSLSSESRKIFVRRYWYVCTIKEIANDYDLSESKVKMLLMRSRNQLREILEKESITL